MGGLPNYQLAHDYFDSHCKIIETNNFRNALWWAEGIHLYYSAVYHKGFSLLLAERRGEAEQLFTQVISGECKGSSSFVAMAKRELDQLIQALTQRGVCKLQTGRKDEAIQDFRASLEFSSHSRNCYALEPHIADLLNTAAMQ